MPSMSPAFANSINFSIVFFGNIACWGASPNPALWDEMPQRDWLRHCRCRAGSLLFCPSFRSDRRLMLWPVIDTRKGGGSLMCKAVSLHFLYQANSQCFLSGISQTWECLPIFTFHPPGFSCCSIRSSEWKHYEP